MTRCRIHIIKPGLYTTLQDLGRTGLQEFGIPFGGAADRSAYNAANGLVGNHEGSPCFEITLAGPEMSFELEGIASAALSGANLSPTLNGNPVNMLQSLKIRDGDRLQFGAPVSGFRSYLAIGGDWKVKTWKGSVSPIRAIPELTPDSLMTKRSVLEIDAAAYRSFDDDPPDIDVDEQTTPLEIYPGPEYDWFTDAQKNHLSSGEFTLSSEVDRMGCRLEESLDFQAKQELISSGVLPGTIQVTNSGQIIILMADAQTTGGYPRIGILTRESLDRLAQVRPRGKVRFELTANS